MGSSSIDDLFNRVQNKKKFGPLVFDETKTSASVLTEADADMIVARMTLKKKETNSKILKIYREQSLCFRPPAPVRAHPFFGSELYLKIYVKMENVGLDESDDLRRKLWMLNYLYDRDSTILEDSLDKINIKLTKLEQDWIKECGRLENLNCFINEKKFEKQ